MIKILDTEYMNEKEASQRYGYSQKWFEKRRFDKKPPPYIKMNGKILYEQEKLDKWFKDCMEEVGY